MIDFNIKIYILSLLLQIEIFGIQSGFGSVSKKTPNRFGRIYYLDSGNNFGLQLGGLGKSLIEFVGNEYNNNLIHSLKYFQSIKYKVNKDFLQFLEKNSKEFILKY